MNDNDVYNNNVCIKIDFEKGSDNPQRVFDSMSLLITSIEEFNSCILSSISAETKSNFLLADIKEGSIKSWLCLDLIGDTSNDRKNKLTTFLNYCTDLIIDFIENKQTIDDLKELDELESLIHQKVNELELEEFPNVFSLNKYKLLHGYSQLTKATENLNPIDQAYFQSSSKIKKINKNFKITKDEVDILLIDDVRNNTTTEILTIKKADFIGNSMWDFIKKKTTIPAKIRDHVWLNKFHRREEIVSPGDGLLCDLVTIVFYDKNNTPIETKYEIIKIHDKIEIKNHQEEIEI